jgi:hypothetical protein
MFIHHFDQKHQILSLTFSGPQTKEDAETFFSVMKSFFLEQDHFFLYLETDGKHSFPPPYNKALAQWFKTHLPILKKQCHGFARVVHQPTLIERLGAMAMTKLFPFPYFVSQDSKKAKAWLEKQILSKVTKGNVSP